ncbi:MAG: hypothetical protein WBA74_10380 [Cyclobacteriaceae bacterium]
MKRYVGVKLINAKPMTRLEYNNFRGWDLPKDENGSDKGFIVEYVDGGKANTKEYEGYISWSPEDVFNNSYFIVPDYGVNYSIKDNYEDYQKRVCEEYSQLNDKIEKLSKYLEKNNNDLLSKQLLFMSGYAVMLEKRIEGFCCD